MLIDNKMIGLVVMDLGAVLFNTILSSLETKNKKYKVEKTSISATALLVTMTNLLSSVNM